MAVGKEILTKIRTTQSTQKITKAMQMVSTSKMRKTQERMRLARPYAEKVRKVMGHLAAANTEISLPILEKRDNIRHAAIILITSDKGLCGGLNANVLKKFFALVQDYQQKGVSVDVVCFGSKGLAAAQRVGLNVIASATGLGDTPHLEVLLGSLKVVYERYNNREIDAVHMVYSGFINTMKQEPRSEILLPIGEDVLQVKPESKHSWDYIYEPDPTTVLDSVIYQAVSDNMASEQAARMVAMKAATDNAGNVIKELRLIYNKSRQAAITTELSEIVAGAAAV